MKGIAILYMLLIAISVWTGTFRDDFEDGNWQGWQIADLDGGVSTWTVEDGILVCNRPNIASSYLMIGERNWRNYSNAWCELV